MRGEAQKEILILKQKRGTTILNIFFNISQGIFLKGDKFVNLWYDAKFQVQISQSVKTL